MNKNLYLDGAANTPLDKKVFKAMKPYMKQKYVGNSFSPHLHGGMAMAAIEQSRRNILNNFGYPEDSEEKVYFTSGSTEANNWVIQSLCLHELEKAHNDPSYVMRNHIVCSSIEHASILSTCEAMKKLGFVISYVKPTGLRHNSPGCITPIKVLKAMTNNTLLVCVMAVNNETGVENQVNEIAKIAHRRNAYILTDITQALSYGGNDINLFEKYPLIDYMTMSGHKIYGPLGVGCLIKASNAPLYSLIHGGHQEDGLRGGTMNTAGIVGLSKAVELMRKFSHKDHYIKLFDYLIKNIDSDVILNIEPSYKNIVSLNIGKIGKFPFQAVDFMDINGVSCSAASACHTEFEPTFEDLTFSYVLKELGFSEKQMINTIRLSFTKFTTIKDIKKFCKIIRRIKEGDNSEHDTTNN